MMTEDARIVSDWVRAIVDIPGYGTPTDLAVLLGVPLERVREAIRMTPAIQPVASVPIFSLGAAKEIKDRIYSGEANGTDVEEGEGVSGELEDEDFEV